jgi:5-methylcytosine-specific restriction endonuclease McrA
MKPVKTTIADLIMEYFKKHPKQDLEHGPVVDWVEEQYLKLYGRKPRDPWRGIRRLYQEGTLNKVRKGVYKYNPDTAQRRELYEFPPKVKEEIFKRDGYKCVVCNRGRKDGVELCADHILSKDKGGTNTIDNGQTLCAEHNLLKKNYSQTEAGKKYFIKLYEQAVRQGDKRMIEFCEQVFDVYNKHHVNTHIARPMRRIKDA